MGNQTDNIRRDKHFDDIQCSGNDYLHADAAIMILYYLLFNKKTGEDVMELERQFYNSKLAGS